MTSDLNLAVLFPESKDITIEKFYRDENTVGWYFKVVLRQQFDYSNYPFDRIYVRIRLCSDDFHQNTVLTPDLGSYAVIHPEIKPGLEREFVIEGWEVQDSFFSYRNNSYNTNFGIENYAHSVSSELYFNVGIRRIFMGIFMSDLITLVVVTLLLFAVLMISTKRKQGIASYGFSSSSVLRYCAALFFVVIISHVSLREKLTSSEVIYLEYFYFVIYFAILIVSINSILVASNIKCNLIHHRDNLVVKLLYWPVISGLILAFTLVTFY